MSKVIEEFTALGFKYPPDQVAVAAMQQLGLAYCFMNGTVTEALDAFRADIPKLEAHIRQIFPSIADFKNSDAFKSMLSKAPK